MPPPQSVRHHLRPAEGEKSPQNSRFLLGKAVWSVAYPGRSSEQAAGQIPGLLLL